MWLKIAFSRPQIFYLGDKNNVIKRLHLSYKLVWRWTWGDWGSKFGHELIWRWCFLVIGVIISDDWVRGGGGGGVRISWSGGALSWRGARITRRRSSRRDVLLLRHGHWPGSHGAEEPGQCGHSHWEERDRDQGQGRGAAPRGGRGTGPTPQAGQGATTPRCRWPRPGGGPLAPRPRLLRCCRRFPRCSSHWGRMLLWACLFCCCCCCCCGRCCWCCCRWYGRVGYCFLRPRARRTTPQLVSTGHRGQETRRLRLGPLQWSHGYMSRVTCHVSRVPSPGHGHSPLWPLCWMDQYWLAGSRSFPGAGTRLGHLKTMC